MVRKTFRWFLTYTRKLRLLNSPLSGDFSPTTTLFIMSLPTKKMLIASGFLLLTMVSFAQVKSGAYRLMLKSLLHHTVPEMQVQAASRDSASLIFLDAREPEEYAVSHIAGSVPVGSDHFTLDSLPKLSKNARILVYCSVGYRSEKVTEQLAAAGYTHVSNLYGGIFEWVNQGHPVVDEQGPTNRVHAFSPAWGVWLRKGKRVYGK